jgi:hypothetical protein
VKAMKYYVLILGGAGGGLGLGAVGWTLAGSFPVGREALLPVLLSH